MPSVLITSANRGLGFEIRQSVPGRWPADGMVGALTQVLWGVRVPTGAELVKPGKLSEPGLISPAGGDTIVGLSQWVIDFNRASVELMRTDG